MNRFSELAYRSLQEQDAYGSQALKSLLFSLSQRSPFYQDLFRTHNINIDAVHSVKDLPLLPTTSKEDLQKHNNDFLCVPRGEIAEYTTTSGTLGKPVTTPLTEKDLARLAYNEHQSFLTADVTREDIIGLALTLDRQFMAGMAYYSGARALGAAVVRTGPGLPAAQWEAIQRCGITTLVAVPSFLLKLVEWGGENNIDLSSSPVKRAVCIGEILRHEDFSPTLLLQRLQDAWPISYRSTYASTEMQTAFTECTAENGGHHQPDLVLVEILDEDGNPVPSRTPGEVVITTLGIEAAPLLRFRTGDVAALHNEPCACGRLSRRLGPVIGRKGQMIKYQGTTLYPSQLFEVLSATSFLEGFVVEVFSGAFGTAEIRLHLHARIPEEETIQKLRALLQSSTRVVPELYFHSAEDLRKMQWPEGARKMVRFIDNRTK